MKKCQLCNKPSEQLTPRLAVGAQGFRQYQTCKACQVKHLVKFELARGAPVKPETVCKWAERLQVPVETIKKEIKRQREEQKV